MRGVLPRIVLGNDVTLEFAMPKGGGKPRKTISARFVTANELSELTSVEPDGKPH
jgi:hypothetical protein